MTTWDRTDRFACTETSIQDSAAQYGIRQRIVDCCSFDMTVSINTPSFNLDVPF